MALQYLTDINLNKNELQNAVIQNLATAPGTPVEGQIYYDSTVGDKQLYFYNGSAWIPVSGDITSVTAGDGWIFQHGVCPELHNQNWRSLTNIR